MNGFAGSGAESLCAREGSEPGYATCNGAGANLALPRGKTITARDVAFPLVDPYSPVARAGIPVPGYTHWPRRRNVLGKRYYGLDGGVSAGAIGTKAKAALEKAFKKEPGFAGMGAFEPGWDDGVGLPPPMVGGSTGTVSSPRVPVNSIDWGRIIAQGIQAAPAIIQASRGGGTPAGFYNTQTGQLETMAQAQQYAPSGYRYNSSGQLVKDAASNVTDFITENPLLVGGVILGTVLLFMRSPSRR